MRPKALVISCLIGLLPYTGYTQTTVTGSGASTPEIIPNRINTLANLADQLGNFQSAGWISGGTVSDAGGGNFTVAAGRGQIRASNSSTATLYIIEWTALTGSVPSNEERYAAIYYNSGNPIVQILSSEPPNYNEYIYLAEIHNVGGTLHIHTDPRPAGDAINRITTWAEGLIGTRVASGEMVTDPTSPSRKIAITAGDVFDRYYRNLTTPTFDSSGAGTFTNYYKDVSSVWYREATQTNWENTKVNNTAAFGNLTSMTTGYFGNRWVVRGFNGDVAVMYGTNEYATSAAAEAESPPASRPPEYDEHGYYVAQITFQKSATSPTTITSIKPQIGGAGGTSAAVTSHNDLSGLQGGIAGQYYHFTSAQATDLTDSGATTLHKHSHTILDDIGTKTHTQIDTHVNATNLDAHGGTATGAITLANIANPIIQQYDDGIWGTTGKRVTIQGHSISANSITLDAQRPTGDYQSVVSADSPVSYWKSDEIWNGTPSEVADSGSANNDGTASGATTTNVVGNYKYGTRGGVYDGINDYVSAGSYTIQNSFTMEAWIKLNNVSGPKGIVGTKIGGATGYDALYVNDSSLRLVIDNDGVNKRYWSSSGLTLSTGVFYHVVVTQSGGIDSNPIFYVNGTAYSSTLAVTGGTPTHQSGTVYIGDLGAVITPFDGYIDEVAIYSTALSATQVLNHYLISSRSMLKVKNSISSNVDLYQDGNIYGGSGNIKYQLAPSVTDGASAIGYLLDTENALSTSGAKLLSIKNNGTEKAYIDKDGKILSPQIYGSTSSTGALTLSSTSHATKGLINFGSNSAYDEFYDYLGINTTTPNSRLHLNGSLATAFTNISGVSSYTATVSNNLMACHAATQNVTITLPAASSITGRQYKIKKTDASSYKCFIDCAAGETIDRVFSSYSGLDTRNESITINSRGTGGWYIFDSY